MLRFKFISILLLSYFELFSQIQIGKDVPFLNSKNTDISIGPVYGLHPNLRNEYPTFYYFMEGNTNFDIKNIPLKMSFRYSNEKLKFGKANYFRLSLDVQSLRQSNFKLYKEEAGSYYYQMLAENKFLSELESKLAFLYQKQKELKLKNQQDSSLWDYNLNDSINFPSYNQFNVIDPSLSLNYNLQIDTTLNVPGYGSPSFEKYNFNSKHNLKQDSLFNLENDYLNSIKNSKEKINDLEGKYQQSLAKYNSIKNQTSGLDFLSSIKKFDIGLTAVGNSSFSSNSLPIEGIRFVYEANKYFIDFSSGFTLPNQLISNKIFDQVVYNSENVLNSSSFFQVNSSRFITNATIGYGNISGNYFAVENYYVGKLHFLENSEKKGTGRTITTNLTGNTKIGFIKGLTWKNTVGLTWFKEDSIYQTKNMEDKIGYSSKLSYDLKKNSIQLNYRYLSKEYDGWVQGVYLQQTDRLEFLLKQSLSRNVRTALRLARNRYAIESIFGRRQTNEGGIDFNLKINTRMFISSSYTLLQLSERNSQTISSNHFSHLGRLILTTTKTAKSFSFVTNHEIGMVSMQVIDTNQQMINAVSGYRFNKDKFGLGLQLNYSRFIGFNEINGQNFVIQPELNFRIKSFYLIANGQYLISQQYGNVFGGKVLLGFNFDKYVGVSFIFQKYLPTDFLFYNVMDDYRKPVYFKMSLNVHLFSPRKK